MEAESNQPASSGSRLSVRPAETMNWKRGLIFGWFAFSLMLLWIATVIIREPSSSFGFAFSVATLVSTFASSIAVLVVYKDRLRGSIDIFTSQQVERAAERVESLPEKAQPAWDLARATLQLYFNRNLTQINQIFWLAAAVMTVGFGLIAFGVWQSFKMKESHVPAILAGVSGVISQLIGATFLYLYRSTMEQANQYVQQLERMNTIGMAMQILDTMKDDAAETNLKDKTKSRLIEMFVRHAHSSSAALANSTVAAAATEIQGIATKS